MNVRYKSTRNADVLVTASEAVLQGLADDGGLFVPEFIPKLEVPLKTLAGKSYQEIALMLNRHVKSIDNALQRVKRKLEKYLEDSAKE